MNKLLSSLLFLSTLLFACKKEHSTGLNNVKDNTLHKVTFNIKVFSQQITGLNSISQRSSNLTTDAVDPSLEANRQIKTLLYAVYDSQGNGVHIIKQKSTDANFGSFTDNLAAGSYTIVFAGGGSSFIIESTAKDGISRLKDDAILHDPAGTGEIFYKKITITVVSGVNNNQSIDLTRLTSKFQLVIKDAIPTGTTSVGVHGITSFTIYMVGADAGGKSRTMTMSQPVTSTDIGTKNFTFTSVGLLPYPGTLQVRLFATNQSNVETAEKSVNITTAPNTMTILTGNLFGGSGGGDGFVPKVDTSWNATPILKQF